MQQQTNLFDDWTCRCSALGLIMIDPKGEISPMDKYLKAEKDWKEAIVQSSGMDDFESKAYQNLSDKINKLDALRKKLKEFKDDAHLSDTCKSYLSQVYTEVTTGRKKIIKNQYIEKGLELEEDAITQYCLKHSIFLEKNKERKNNSFIEGEADIPQGNKVTDTKVSWDLFTFDRTVLKLNKLYKWQGKGYCILWNVTEAEISYHLLNTPDKLLLNEEKKLLYNWIGSSEEYDEALEELRHNHIFDDLPSERKERCYSVKLEEGDEQKINSRVLECRKFLNNYESQGTR